MTDNPLLKVEGLKKVYTIGGGFLGRPPVRIKAVDGVDLSINKNETLGLVGESGCGKTTLGRCILRLEEPTEGRVTLEGRDLGQLSRQEMRKIRREMQIIFQDPYSSLNPRKNVERLITESLKIHQLADRRERRERLKELLDMVGLRPEAGSRYPHEFSGGQRQRICVARALALNPKLIVADEPVSALDVSIQAQVLNLLVDLQNKLGLTYLFISHDLSVVRHFCDRVAVMYMGRIVETAPGADLFENPQHPYTRALLAAVPGSGSLKYGRNQRLRGEVPSQTNPPPGCPFHPRCEIKKKICQEQRPDLATVAPGHQAACHY